MNIDARLQWILDNLKQPSGDAWNQKALARAMGLPSPAHVGMIVRGEIEDPRGSFLAALVRATGVNGHWLLTGQGEPLHTEPTAPPTDLSDKPLWKNLPNWRELQASAKTLARRAKGDAVALAASTGLPVWACELRLAAVRHGLG